MKPELFTIIPVIIIGWVAGVLVNYLGDVLPNRRSLVTPFCFHCQQSFSWLNYIVWPRKCMNCQKRRSPRTWIVEVVFIIACLWIWRTPPERLGFFIGVVWLVYFGVIIVIDVEHHLILHPVSWAGAVLGVLTGVWLHGWISTLIGGAVGFGVMLGFYWLGIAYVRFVARKKGQTIEEGDAFGFGDVNLSGVIGLLLGWPGIVAGLVFAILFSGAFILLYLGGMLIARRYTPNMALPYGPFLAASALFLLFIR